MIGPHDIAERIENDRVRCACGSEFDSAFRHEQHFQLERARAALRGDEEETRGA